MNNENEQSTMLSSEFENYCFTTSTFMTLTACTRQVSTHWNLGSFVPHWTRMKSYKTRLYKPHEILTGLVIKIKAINNDSNNDNDNKKRRVLPRGNI